MDLCKRVVCLCASLWLFAVVVKAQTGSVTLNARVSEAVALSIPPNSVQGDVDVNVLSSGRTVRMTLSGTSDKSPVIRVPLMVRSNSSFRISASFESKTALLAQMSVSDVRATGGLVSLAAVNNLEKPEHLDLETREGPFLVATGPRVSLGGTLDSPNNALQIRLLIHIKPQPGRDWLVHLTFFND
jgi:hypothetical protein